MPDRPAVVATIETIPLRIPLKVDSLPGASLWGDPLTAADSLLVKVTTRDGVEGWGEAFGFRAVDSAKLAVDQLITPLCIGQDATRIGPLMLASLTFARLALAIVPARKSGALPKRPW
jgi:L-alanine-DL-glutamate epimerase-like enolase superfamily enzyme